MSNFELSGSKTYSIDDIIKMATEVGVRIARDEINRQKQEKFKERQDRRFRNTRLLMQNFRGLKIHFNESIYKLNKQSPVHILEEIDDFDGDNTLIIESISHSRERTLIILNHLSKMMDIFRFMMDTSKKDEDVRKFKTIQMFYIDDISYTAEEVAKTLCIDTRTVHRYKNEGLTILSGLIFGIDGLKWNN